MPAANPLEKKVWFCFTFFLYSLLPFLGCTEGLLLLLLLSLLLLCLFSLLLLLLLLLSVHFATVRTFERSAGGSVLELCSANEHRPESPRETPCLRVLPP